MKALNFETLKKSLSFKDYVFFVQKNNISLVNLKGKTSKSDLGVVGQRYFPEDFGEASEEIKTISRGLKIFFFGRGN